MGLPSSGAISLSDIQDEFGGTNPISISEYYEASLFSFGGHTFTPAGATGRTGPTLTQCRNAYNVAWDTNTSFFNMTTQGIQQWTVPRSGTYKIVCKGASGGAFGGTYYPGFPGGGAQMEATFVLMKNQILNIVVGQKPTSTSTSGVSGSAGGGASWVYTGSIGGSSGLLVVAGGGGGTGHGGSNTTAGNGRGGNSGTNSLESSSSAAVGTGSNARTGTGSAGNKGVGQGGRGTTTGMYYGSGGGAGWNSDGNTNENGGGGSSTGYGGDGGTRFEGGQGNNTTHSHGGFGGGGGSGGSGNAGGGGGGYTGGGAGQGYSGTTWGGGGGGGSYIDSQGSNTTKTAGADAIDQNQVHDGHVSIELIDGIPSSGTISFNQFYGLIGPVPLQYNGTDYGSGDSFTITGAQAERTFTISAGAKIRFQLYGGAGGRGKWNGNNSLGGKGGYVSVDITFSSNTTLYAYVGQGHDAVSRTSSAGAGGGSTDIRTTKASGSSGSVTDSTFVSNFYSGMSSTLAVAGGGGGAHGGSQSTGSNRPGDGGPTTTQTNQMYSGSAGSGASTSSGGSVQTYSGYPAYTTSGVFGGGGNSSGSNGIPRTDWAVGSSSYQGWAFTGYGWPNGGIGNQWAVGGGGGGYYGGATNWPNGGGGSNFITGSNSSYAITTNSNTSHSTQETGKLIVTVL